MGRLRSGSRCPNVVGVCASSGLTNSGGTGALAGRVRAEMSRVEPGLVMWKTIVELFGVWMPGIGPPVYFAVTPTSGAGEAAPK